MQDPARSDRFAHDCCHHRCGNSFGTSPVRPGRDWRRVDESARTRRAALCPLPRRRRPTTPAPTAVTAAFWAVRRKMEMTATDQANPYGPKLADLMNADPISPRVDTTFPQARRRQA